MRISGLQNQKGLTLLELVIAIALVGVLVTPVIVGVVNSAGVNLKSKDTINATLIAEKVCEEVQVGNYRDLNGTMGLEEDYNGRKYTARISLVQTEEVVPSGYEAEKGYRNYYLIRQAGNAISVIYKSQDGTQITKGYMADIKSPNISTVGFAVVFKTGSVEVYRDSSMLDSSNLMLRVNETVENIRLEFENNIPISLYNVMNPERVVNVFGDLSLISNNVNINYDKNIIFCDIRDLDTHMTTETRKKNKYTIEVVNDRNELIIKKDTYFVQ